MLCNAASADSAWVAIAASAMGAPLVGAFAAGTLVEDEAGLDGGACTQTMLEHRSSATISEHRTRERMPSGRQKALRALSDWRVSSSLSIPIINQSTRPGETGL